MTQLHVDVFVADKQNQSVRRAHCSAVYMSVRADGAIDLLSHCIDRHNTSSAARTRDQQRHDSMVDREVYREEVVKQRHYCQR